MNTIKLETVTRLETLFMSIDNTNYDKLDEILDTSEIDIPTKSAIRKFQTLVKQVNR